jgi:O-acetyl-ADP-ribose deacetylase (regulator of RNase III)
MGAGIAKAIREVHPIAYQVDKIDKRDPEDRYGSFSKAIDPSGVTIYNLYSQFRYGHDKRYTNYHKMYDSLRLMKYDILSDSKTESVYDTAKIGFPKLGCGLAGGDWDIVQRIIEKVFQDKLVHVYQIG